MARLSALDAADQEKVSGMLPKITLLKLTLARAATRSAGPAPSPSSSSRANIKTHWSAAPIGLMKRV